MTGEKKNVFDIVNERLIAALEKGVVPWQQPWNDAGIPANLKSGRQYRNINHILLSMLGYERNLFLTWNQIQEIGAKVKKGEHAHMVVFSKPGEMKTDEQGNEEKSKSVLRYYFVFNIAQCENIPKKYIQPLPEREIEPLQRCSEMVEYMPTRPEIIHDKHQAFYDPADDYINMPKIATFKDSQGYYATLFHEMVHSTGHESRLNRKSLTTHDRENYSIEELTAEIGACYLRSEAGIAESDYSNSAAYIDNWLNTLKNDRKFIFIASSQAQRAVDYILDIVQPEVTETALSGVEVPGDIGDLPF